MRKILLIILLSFYSFAYAQDSITEMSSSKEKNESETAEQNKLDTIDYKIKCFQKSNIDLAGLYLKRSANLQYAAIGCSAISAAFFYFSTSENDEFEVNENNGKVTKKTNWKKNALIVGGGASLLLALFFELSSISFKWKSGNYLRIHASEYGAGLSFVF